MQALAKLREQQLELQGSTRRWALALAGSASAQAPCILAPNPSPQPCLDG